MFECWGWVRVWMGVGCPCPPVRNDIVTPRHLFTSGCLVYFCDISTEIVNMMYKLKVFGKVQSEGTRRVYQAVYLLTMEMKLKIEIKIRRNQSHEEAICFGIRVVFLTWIDF